MHNATLSSYSYDFRKDFSDIAQPGLHRYLDAVGAPPDNGDWVNLRWYRAKQYVRELWNGLNSIQRDCRKRGHSDDFELYDINDWTRESVATYVEARPGDILVDMEPAASRHIPSRPPWHGDGAKAERRRRFALHDRSRARSRRLRGGPPEVENRAQLRLQSGDGSALRFTELPLSQRNERRRESRLSRPL